MKRTTFRRLLALVVFLSLVATLARWPTTVQGPCVGPTKQYKYDYDSNSYPYSHDQLWVLDRRGREIHLNAAAGHPEYPTFLAIAAKNSWNTRVRFRCLWWEPYVTKDVSWWNLEIEPDPRESTAK